ncbi:MAG: GTP-binding protein [Acinetobacter sp.]|nr:MAG: GTP-binding protein [Acinetobacter sp.]
MILQQYKIVFGGSMGAGKSAAIQSLSDIPVLTTETMNTDVNAHQKQLTTVGIDYGEVTLDNDLKIGLYGTPGQNRFDFMWSVICKGAIGTVILIDHSSMNSLQDLEFYVSAFADFTDNMVIGITHIDEKPEKITTIYHEWLAKYQKSYPLFHIDARNKKDVLLLIDALIASVEVNLEKLNQEE